jgi:hypothetical protein
MRTYYRHQNEAGGDLHVSDDDSDSDSSESSHDSNYSSGQDEIRIASKADNGAQFGKERSLQDLLCHWGPT